MPCFISVHRFSAVIGAAAWLVACSDPPQPQASAPAASTQAAVEKGPTTAKVAVQPDPVVPASDAPVLSLDNASPDVSPLPPRSAVANPTLSPAQAEPAAATPAEAIGPPPLVRAIDQASAPNPTPGGRRAGR